MQEGLAIISDLPAKPGSVSASTRAYTRPVPTSRVSIRSMPKRCRPPRHRDPRCTRKAQQAHHSSPPASTTHSAMTWRSSYITRLIESKARPGPRTRPLEVSRAASSRMCLLIAMLLNPGTECLLPKAMICSMVDVVNQMQHCLFDGLSGWMKKKQSRSERLPDGTGTASWHPVGSTSTLHGPTGDQKPKGPTWQRQASMFQPLSCWAMDIDNARLVGSRNHRAVANGGSSNASARMAHRTSSRTWRSPRLGPRRSSGHRSRSMPMCR
jgi:hypothetical protein